MRKRGFWEPRGNSQKEKRAVEKKKRGKQKTPIQNVDRVQAHAGRQWKTHLVNCVGILKRWSGVPPEKAGWNPNLTCEPKHGEKGGGGGKARRKRVVLLFLIKGAHFQSCTLSAAGRWGPNSETAHRWKRGASKTREAKKANRGWKPQHRRQNSKNTPTRRRERRGNLSSWVC